MPGSRSISSMPSVNMNFFRKMSSKFNDFSEAIPDSRQSPFLMKRNLSRIRQKKAAFISFHKLTSNLLTYI